METYGIKGWETFQHYKKRNPPWVKLHGSMLTSVAWLKGNDLDRSLIVASILLAARYHNAIPLDMDILRPAAGLKCTEEKFHQSLAFLEQCDFITIAKRKQRASTTQARQERDDSKVLVSEEESRGREVRTPMAEISEGSREHVTPPAEKPPLAIVAPIKPTPPVGDFDPERDAGQRLAREAFAVEKFDQGRVPRSSATTLASASAESDPGSSEAVLEAYG